MSCDSCRLRRADIGIELLNSSFSLRNGRLHEFDGRSIGITHIDDALSGIRTGFQDLRFARGFPTRRGDSVKHSVKIIHEQSNVNVSDIARTNFRTFPIGRREILEQFDFMTAERFQDSKLDLGTCDSGDFPGHFASLMCGM